MILLDKLAYSSPIRRRSPGLKCLFAVGSLLVCAGFRQPGVCALIFLCMAGCTLRLANVSPGRYLRFLAGPAVFLALSSAAILFYLSSAPQDLFSLALGPRYLGVSSQSLASWLQLMAVAFSSVACLYFLILTTPVTDLLAVLRRLHCPWLLLELMLLIYRFIFILMSVASSITVSQHSRLGNRNYRTSLKSFGALASVLLLRSFQRANALYDAMEARCYDGSIRVLNENFPPKPREILLIAGFDLLLLLFVLSERYLL